MRLSRFGFATITAALVLWSADPLFAQWPEVLKQAQDRCERAQSAIQNMVIVEEMVMPTDNGPITAEQTLYRKGGKSRMEMSLPPMAEGMGDMTTIVINTGTESWMFNSFSGKRKLDPTEAEQQGDFRDCWDFLPDNSQIIGSGESQGRDCYLVELQRDSITHKLWLDKENLMVIQGESQTPNAAIRWILSDFRKVIGEYMHPYKIEMLDGDQPISTMIVKSITVNQSLSDDLFDPDKVELKTLDMEEIMRQMFQNAEPDSQ